MENNRIQTKILYVNTIKPHFSAEQLEIVIVLKGNISMQKVDRNVMLQEGEFTLINRYIVHSIQSEGAYILVAKIHLQEFKDIFEKIDYVEFLNNDELLAVDRPLKKRLNQILVEMVVNQYCFQYGLDNFNNLEEMKLNEQHLVQMLFTFYQLISHMKQREEYATEELESRYYHVVAYVFQHMHEKIVVEDILKELYMNPTYFSQFMKKIGGVGFKDFVQYRKLIIVQGYLLDNRLSMAEIAAQVGIYDMKSFYTTFKRYFKKSPRAWREEIVGIDDCYSEVREYKVLEEFIKKYHINAFQDTNGTKVYKYLIALKKQGDLNLEGVEVVFNPYDNIGENVDPHYQVYKHLNDLIHEIYEAKAILHLTYPYRNLKNMEHRYLFMNTMMMLTTKLGGSKLKKFRISFIVESEIELSEARLLKNEAREKIGINNIHIVMKLGI